MNNSHRRIWFIVTFTLAAVAIIIRAIWQIVVIPTPGTMLIFIPLILGMFGANALFAYLIINPDKFRTLPFLTGITVALTAGLIAGVTHFVRFIISPDADPFWSKIIGWLVLSSSVSAYFLILNYIWSLRNKRIHEQ
jgi:hypothetical protein